MSANRCLGALILCFLLCLCVLFCGVSEATDLWPGSETRGLFGPADTSATGPAILNDTADVVIAYDFARPGCRDFLMTMYLSSPVAIAGFDFEILSTPPDLADFSTVQWYIDSLDTCPDPEETCWYFRLVRECLIQRGPFIGDWSIFEARGAAGDSNSAACDTLRIVGIAIVGTPIPPQSGYVALLSFGVDAACIPDTVADRTTTFDFTGHLSTPLGELVPFRTQAGKLDLLWSIPGNANADSLVDLGDIIFLLNYLYKAGLDPCAMEAADPNSDCAVDLGDVIYLINFLFKGGPSPQPGCVH